MKNESRPSALPNILVAIFTMTAIAGACLTTHLWRQTSILRSHTIPKAMSDLADIRKEAAEINEIIRQLGSLPAEPSRNIEQDLHAFAAAANFQLRAVTPRIVEGHNFIERQVVLTIQDVPRRGIRDFLTNIHSRRPDANITSIICTFKDNEPYDVKNASITVVTYEGKEQ